MTDNVVLVTGAGRGIGRAVAMALAEDGWAVVVNDPGSGPDGSTTDEDPASEVVSEIVGRGGLAVLDTSDITSWDNAHRMVARAVDSFGRLDGVVNCAGILRDRIFHQMSEEEYDSVIRVHLKGYFNVSRAAAPIFRRQGSGAYVHLTSTSGLIGNRGQANYSSAKMGVVGLSRSIALDMARFGVRSNAIAPFAASRLIGVLPTETPEEQARVAKFNSMTPEQIAPLVLFLLGPDAHEVSGQIFVVRRNEIMLMSQPRPVRTLHRADGWSLEHLRDLLVPAWRTSFTPLESSPDVFSWDPI